jgi:hypothetical protein
MTTNSGAIVFDTAQIARKANAPSSACAIAAKSSYSHFESHDLDTELHAIDREQRLDESPVTAEGRTQPRTIGASR